MVFEPAFNFLHKKKFSIKIELEHYLTEGLSSTVILKLGRRLPILTELLNSYDLWADQKVNGSGIYIRLIYTCPILANLNQLLG